ncbi:MarR family winged helix-turn-helix transcriptional regulator [Gorillibacterium massiliense]|uniref:MarR family winged helix-turn-helix transcriptional regulator n=1 Tax=Gorillibacterium massiliense TaxID=1280390 RepID=UPI0004BCD16D|nr:MarR family transcriptional regulator [Gorillibacterium massiliense]
MAENALFMKFVAFTAAVHKVTHEMTKETGNLAVTPAQYKILEYIAINQPVSLSEISDCMHMSMPNTSRELKKLEEKALCEKAATAEDRRKMDIQLSKNGQVMMDGIFQRIEAQFNRRMESLSEDERLELERALDLLHAKMFS